MSLLPIPEKFGNWSKSAPHRLQGLKNDILEYDNVLSHAVKIRKVEKCSIKFTIFPCFPSESVVY